MTETLFERMRDQLPDLAAGTLDPTRADRLKAALETDEDLRGEYELILAMRRQRPEAPPGLADRIRHGVNLGPRRRRWSLWPLSTAAVLVIALGTAVLWRSGGDPGPSLPEDEPLPTLFSRDDGLVAGAFVLGDLSDDELEALLVEIGG